MKRIFFLFVFNIFLLWFVLFLANFVFTNKKSDQNYKIMSYQLEGRKYQLLVADNVQKWQTGLMNFRKLEGIQGMIFIFPDKQIRHFWNKNTYLDLDVYWINEDKVEGKSFLPSIERSKEIVTVSSPAKVNKVVEIVIH